MAGAATIETKTVNEQDFSLWENELQRSALLSAEEVYPEVFETVRRELPKAIGAAALAGAAEVMQSKYAEKSTLLDKLKLASSGDVRAQNMVHTNVATDVAERLFKTAHQTIIPLEIMHGRLMQDETPLIEINKNTFRHMELNSVMRERTNIECRNTLIFEKLISAGALEDYDAVVFSNAPVDKQTRKEYRFFTETDSLSIQYLKMQNDAFVMETAMYAGKRHKNDERHDFNAVRELTGLTIEPSDNGMLQHVLLVPKTDKGGVHTVVEQLDDIVEQLHDDGDIFYGENKSRRDYEEYRAVCEQRTNDFEDIVSKVLDDLMLETGSFSDPYEAIERLDELSDKYCVGAAVTRKDIDVRVFGSTAAAHIEEARFFHDIGNHERAEMSLQKAEETSQSGSCPILSKKGSGIGEDGESSADGEDEFGSLSFSCPSCNKKNTRKPGKKNFLTNCKHCAADVTC